jgi:hypothetical protein
MRSLKIIFVLIFFILVTTTFIFSDVSKVRVTASKANIRLSPNTQSPIISTVPLGAVLDVIKKEGNWYYIKLSPNEKSFVVTGYIHQSIVEVVEEIKEIPQEEKVEEEKPPEITPPIIKKPPVIKEERPPKVEPLYPIEKAPGPPRKIAFKIGGGINSPLGDWADYYDLGFGAYGSIIYPVQPRFDLIGGVEFFRNTGGMEALGCKTDCSLSRFIFFGDGRYNFKGKGVTFFGEGGLGIYYDRTKSKISFLEIMISEVSDSETNLGFRVGGGVAFRNIEIIGMFHIVEDSNMFTLGASYRF